MALSDLEINTLSYIRDALAEIEEAKGDAGISDDFDGKLTDLYDALDAISDLIMTSDVERYLTQLKGDEAGLKQVISGMQADINRIGDLSKAVSKAATAIGAIVDIAAKATAAGLL